LVTMTHKRGTAMPPNLCEVLKGARRLSLKIHEYGVGKYFQTGGSCVHLEWRHILCIATPLDPSRHDPPWYAMRNPFLILRPENQHGGQVAAKPHHTSWRFQDK